MKNANDDTRNLDHDQPPTLKLGCYRHYKGGEYELIGVARHTETEELMAVYKCLYKNGELWVRPLSIFVDQAATGEQRFTYIGQASQSGGKQ